VAILCLDEKGAKLNIQNNIDMRNKAAEARLMMIGERYYKKMWDQSKSGKFDYSEERDTLTNSEPKETDSRKCYCATLKQTQTNPKKISHCLNFNTEIKEKEEELPECNEESQKEEKSDRTNSEFMKDIIQHQTSQHDESEEVIHSEGETLEELCPDNTWDSGDALKKLL